MIGIVSRSSAAQRARSRVNAVAKASARSKVARACATAAGSGTRLRRLYHVERETPSASHGRCGGRLGPIPCARRQRSERKRAFSRRIARATGQNLTFGIRFHARRRADMGVRSAPPVDAREIEGSNGLQDLRTNRICHGDRGQYSARANGYDFMTSRSFTRSIRGWEGSLQIPIRVVSTI